MRAKTCLIVLLTMICSGFGPFDPLSAQTIQFVPTQPRPTHREFYPGPTAPQTTGQATQDALNALGGTDHVNLLIDAQLGQNFFPGSGNKGTVATAIVTDAECASLSMWYTGDLHEICVKLVTAGYVDPQNKAVQDAAVAAVKAVDDNLNAKLDRQLKTIELLQKRIESLEKTRQQR